MAKWRIGRGWSESELEELMAAAHRLPLAFGGDREQMTQENGWHRYGSQAAVGYEDAGPPLTDGPFARGCSSIANYKFSDPRIVVAHFDPAKPLLRRHLLLELLAGPLHFLVPVVISAVREETNDNETVFGFRYDTLQGHIEHGSEWFLLTKNHETGEIRFQISAIWRPGEFPNWWSRVGFHFVGPQYQEKWHRRAHLRLFRDIHDSRFEPPKPRPGRRLAHQDALEPEVAFERWPARAQ